MTPVPLPSAASPVVLAGVSAGELPPSTLAVVVLAAVGTGVLFALSLAAYLRRRTVPYGLVTVAIGMLLVRSVVGAGTVLGYVPMPAHHFLEHGFDFLIAACVLTAVYLGRPTGRRDADPE